MENKKPHRKNIADEYAAEIIQQLKEGTAPWQKPWKAGELHMPFNPSSGTNYRGINVAMLAGHGYADPRWMTFKQAQEKGYKVKKGSKSQRVVFWQWQDRQNMLDDNGRPVLDSDGKPVKETVDLARPRLYVYNAFHISKLQDEKGNDLPPFEAKEPEWNPHERAEAIIRASGLEIIHDQRDRAYYTHGEDAIHLPPRENFPDAGHYYSTALHELGHSLGHKSRLDWESASAPFGSPEYAKEELRVEIASWMLCQELGLPYDPGQHVAYAESWVKALEDDPYEIMRACQMAEKIKSHILDMEHGLTAEQNLAEQEPGLFNQWATPDYSQMAGGDMLRVMNDLQRAAELPSVDRLLKTVTAAKENSNIVPFPPFSAALDNIEQIGRDIADSGREDDHPEFEENWKAVASVINKFELELKAKEKEREGFDQSTAGVPEKPLEYEVAALRRVRSVDGNQPKPWLEAEAGQAEFYAVVEKGSGKIVSTSATLEEAELKSLAKNKDGSSLPSVSDEKVMLNVPYKEKSVAKALGATWDSGQKSWCVRPGADIAPLERWLPENTLEKLVDKGVLKAPDAAPEASNEVKQAAIDKAAAITEPAPEKTFLAVPYKEKEAAKKLGAKWDRNAGLWYAPEGTDLAPLAKFIPEKTPAPAKEISPEAEFAQALEKAGLKIEGLPIIDGKIHRVPVIDGRPGNRDGAYCAYADGRPAGWMMNYRTGGEKVNWVASGQTLTVEQKASLLLQADERKAEREAQRQAAQEEAIEKAFDKWTYKAQVGWGEIDSHPYLTKKGVVAYGLKEDGKGNLLVPGCDQDGKLKTIQTINANGDKYFEPGCPKAGAMHIIGEDEENGRPEKIRDIKAPKIYISEGYATGATVHLATDSPVVMAFDANNLKAVAMAVREIHPEANIILCADNDHKTDKNVGLEKAQEAAQAVGGEVISPEFTKEEMAQGLTDFNDLHQARGIGVVRDAFQKQQLGRAAAQVKAAVAPKVGAGMGL